MESPQVHGRGTSDNPRNRFLPIAVVRDTWDDPSDPQPHTQFLTDATRSIISWNDSPDLGFNASLNPYRGCEHGCVYCYARPNHEFLGFSAGLDFETRILVKQRAPDLLRRALASRRWEPQVVMMSGVTDAYQPVERRLGITRRCLEVLAEFRNPVAIVTKNHLVTRDADLLGEMASYGAARVTVSITTLDDRLHRLMEPRTSAPRRRLRAIESLAAAGVPVGVNVAPVIPGLTDHEMPQILAAAASAGATTAAYIPLRLPLVVADLFESWLESHFPLRKDKVLNKIRETRGGRLNDPRLGFRMKGTGPVASQISQLFRISCRRTGLSRKLPPLSSAAFR
ncbi:MAG: PA0069 family radical SAM protein, partial [Gemmatimonadota bacterium]